jgi:hypothetical protein
MDISDELFEVAGAYLLPLRSIDDTVNKKAGTKVLIETPLGFKDAGS